jgi:sugar-specific transcriptional regulator TrmB
LYVEIDGRPDWYKGYNPSNIITDRIAVCQNFKGTHPKVVQKTLERMFGPPLFEIEEIPRFEEIGDKIGIVMSPSFSAREELIAVLGKKEYEYIAICTEKPDPETLLKMLEEFKDDIGAVKSKHIFLILRGIFFKIGLPHNLEDAILHEGYTIKEV